MTVTLTRDCDSVMVRIVRIEAGGVVVAAAPSQHGGAVTWSGLWHAAPGPGLAVTVLRPATRQRHPAGAGHAKPRIHQLQKMNAGQSSWQELMSSCCQERTGHGRKERILQNPEARLSASPCGVGIFFRSDYSGALVVSSLVPDGKLTEKIFGNLKL